MMRLLPSLRVTVLVGVLLLAAVLPAATRADTPFVPCLIVSAFGMECYAPSDAAIAEARVYPPPVSPLTVATSVITLPLAQVGIQLAVPRTARPTQPITLGETAPAYAISYIFGDHLPVNSTLPQCPVVGTHGPPPYVYVQEGVGHYGPAVVGVGVVGCPDGSSTWGASVNLPGHDLVLYVASNIDAQTVQALTQRLVDYAATLPPVPTPTATRAPSPTPAPANTPITGTASVTPTLTPAPPLNVQVSARALTVGNAVTVRVRTAPRGQVSLVVRAVLVPVPAHATNPQTRPRIAPALLAEGGAADARGLFQRRLRLRLTSQPRTALHLVLTVTVRTTHGTASQSVPILLQPARH